MSEHEDKPEEESQQSAAPGPLAGERLAEARRAQQIAVVEIAKELHLDEYKVRAMERNDFDVIGAPVFAKGHLRKYAQLVRVSQDDIMSDYYQLERSPGAPPVLRTRRRSRQEVSPLPWVIAVVVIAIVAAAYWWFANRETATPDTQPSNTGAQPQGDFAAAVDAPGDEAVDAVNDATMDDTPDDEGSAIESALDDGEVAAVDEPATLSELLPTETAATLASGQLALSVTYSGDCWTEITDANGRRLFFGLGSNGRNVNLSGAAPFNALFGNAANVTLEVNGAPFDIPVASRSGRTAKLTIPGS